MSLFAFLFTLFCPLPEDLTPVWYYEGGQAFAELGKSSCIAGDINGDGYADILAGMHFYSGPEYHEGKVLLFYGGPDGPSTTPDWSWESNQANATLGISIDGAGDVNGDGFDDFIVGAQGYSGLTTNEGGIFLFYGSPSGPSESPDWSAFSGQSGCDFGGTVASAGDINNDGFDDIITGAVFYSNGESSEGRTYVYFGGSSGPTSTPWINEINLAGAQFGGDVSGAGDLNNDGFDDIVSGARQYTNGENQEGAVFVFYGSPSGLGSEYDWMYESGDAKSKLGQSVANAGDVNGDGYDDMLASAHNFKGPEDKEGKVYVFLGSEMGLSSVPSFELESNINNALLGNRVDGVGDINGDGYDDIIAGARQYTNGEIDEGAAFIIYGGADGPLIDAYTIYESNQENAYFGYAVGGEGDVNGDGINDFIVGAKYWSNSYPEEGAVFLYYGENPIMECSAPTDIMVTDITSTTATISWSGSELASFYKVLLRPLGPGSTIVTGTGLTNFEVTGLVPTTTYKVLIAAKCGDTFYKASPIALTTD